MPPWRQPGGTERRDGRLRQACILEATAAEDDRRLTNLYRNGGNGKGESIVERADI